MSSKGHGSKIIANSSWNMCSFLVGVCLNLFTIPFAVKHLGVETFGVAGLVTACVVPATILSVTLMQMTSRELAQLLEPDQLEAAREVISTALAIALCSALLMMALLAIAGPAASIYLFNLRHVNQSTLALSFCLAALTWVSTMISGVIQAIYLARQLYSRVAQINIISTAVMALSVCTLVPQWPSVPVYLACLTAGALSGLLSWCFVALRTFPEYFERPRLHKKPLQALLHVGSWQVASQAGGLVSGQMDRYLLGAFLRPEFVGYYNIAQRLEEAVYIGVLKIGEVLFPLFGAMLKEDTERQADIFFRSSWILNLLAVSVLGALIPHAKDLLRLWTTTDVAEQAQWILISLAIAGILGSSANVFGFYLLGSGKTFLSALLSITTAIIIVTTGAVALPLWGWKAAGWSTIAGMATQICMVVLLLPRCFPSSDIQRRMIHFVILPVVTGLACSGTLRCWAWNGFIKGPAVLWQVIAMAGTSVILIAAAVVIAASIGPYRSVCWNDLTNIFSTILRFNRNQ